MSQHMDALERANEVRLERSATKRAIRDGRLSLKAALGLGCVQGMRIFDLLQAQRGWGSSGKVNSGGVKAKRTLGTLGISPYRVVEDLTERQRVLLVEEASAVGRKR